MLKINPFKILVTLIFCGILGVISFFAYQKVAKKPDLTVMGFINRADGLGRQSAELIETFKNDFKITFIPTRKQRKKDIPRDFKKYVTERESRWGRVVIFEDMLWSPYVNPNQKIYSCPSDSIRIAYSMWESTKIPSEWVVILNRYFDAVVVPSKFLIDVYKNSGVNLPVFELPLGLNLKKWFQKPLKESCGNPMVFANLSACGDRKNQLALIRAFAKAFGNDPRVLLRINSRFGESEIKNAITKEIAQLNFENIVFTQFSLSSEEYLEEFQKVDCYVSPSKGEGFSIQPREAMALGIPVIATDNTAQSVICESGLIKAIPSSILEPAIYPWGDYYGLNYNCDIDDLVDALRDVRENYSVYLSKCSESREWVKQYQFQNLKEFYKTLIHPKKIILGKENKITEEGIITTSKELFEKYRDSFNDIEVISPM